MAHTSDGRIYWQASIPWPVQSAKMPHHDILSALNEATSLKERLIHCHRVVQGHLPFIARIAVTLYDPNTRVLKTYVHSSGGEGPLSNYQARLEDAPRFRRSWTKANRE